jgi:hypothetical protein
MEIENNILYLNRQVKLTGFGETHEVALRDQIAKGQDSFTLPIEKQIGTDQTTSNLTFNKGDKGYYFFNEYNTQITTRPDDPLASKVESYKIDSKNPKNNITLKEAYNLKLKGSVEKEISYQRKNENTGKSETHSFVTWKKTDPTQSNVYNEHPKKSYNYTHMEADLRKLPIKEFGDPDEKEKLIAALKKGNAPLVTLVEGATEIKRYINIDAEFKTINVHESNPRLYKSNAMQEEEKKAIEAGKAAKNDINAAVTSQKPGKGAAKENGNTVNNSSSAVTKKKRNVKKV